MKSRSNSMIQIGRGIRGFQCCFVELVEGFSVVLWRVSVLFCGERFSVVCGAFQCCFVERFSVVLWRYFSLNGIHAIN